MGVCENQHFFSVLLTFLSYFYYFHGDFGHSQNVDVSSFFWGVGGLRKCMVCTLMKMLTFTDGHLLILNKMYLHYSTLCK